MAKSYGKTYFFSSQIQKMKFPQLKQYVESGDISEKRLREYYTEARRKAMGRKKRVSASGIVEEFGNDEREYFMRTKNITTTSQLLHEIVDVNRYLNSKRSTITGLRQQRQNTIDMASELGFDIDEDNYRDFIKFMQWFKASEYSKAYDSDSQTVLSVFNESRADPASWQQAFETFQSVESENEAAPVRRY